MNGGVGRKPFLNDYTLSSGSIEWLKFIGLLTMTIDHVNHFHLSSQYQFLQDIGRVAFPLFVMLFAFNYAKHPDGAKELHKRISKKLLLSGLLALPACLFFKIEINQKQSEWLASPWYDHLAYLYPLNIMFGLYALGLFLVYVESYREEKKEQFIVLGVFLFFFLSLIAEYNFSIISIGLGFYLINKHHLKLVWWFGLFFFIAGVLYLNYSINDSYYSLVVLPLFWLASVKRFAVPRLRSFFYFYYPIHISVLVFVL